MATLTLSFADRLRHAFAAPLAGFDALFTAIYRANGLARDIEQIMTISDAELERRGITRDAAVRNAAMNRGYF